jgi:urea transporter
LPAGALVAFHAFRLPLELVLHAWYTAGSVPIQLTYAGQNLDLITGVAAVIVGAAALARPAAARPLVWAFNVLGSVLLLNVMRIVVGSLPSPLRTFTDAPPLLLPFAAPFTWIVPLAVGPALLGHVVLFRALLGGRARVAFPPAREAATSAHAPSSRC